MPQKILCPEYPIKAYTHGGIFHADDVFAYAFLKIFTSEIKLMRVNHITSEIYDEAEFSNGKVIIFDIGNGKFDHHSKECTEYRNTEKNWNPYAAFGKIVRYYRGYVFNSELEYQIFDSILVTAIDKQDCTGSLYGGCSNELSMAIGAFNYTWQEFDSDEAQNDKNFYEAAMIAEMIIGRYIKKARAIAASQTIIENALKSYTGEYYIALDQYVNYHSYLKDQNINWVIYPSKRGGWQLYSILERGINRQLIDAATQEHFLKNFKCSFVHSGGFTAIFDTKEEAICAAVYLANIWNATHKT